MARGQFQQKRNVRSGQTILSRGQTQQKRDVRSFQPILPKGLVQHKQDVRSGQSMLSRVQTQHKRDVRSVQAMLSKGQFQPKRDVHSGQTILSKGQFQPKRDVHCGQTILSKGQFQPKRDVHCGQTILSKGQFQPKRDVHSGQTILSKGQFQPKRDVHSGQAILSKGQFQPKRDVHSGQAILSKGQVQPKRDVHSGQAMLSKGQVQPKRDVHSGQAMLSKGQVQPKRDVHSRQAIVQRGQLQHKQVVKSGQASVSRWQVQPKRDTHSSQASVQRGQIQHKRDVRSGQAKNIKSDPSVPRSQVQHRKDVKSVQASLPRGHDQHTRGNSGKRRDVPKQPKDSTRFLSDLQSSGNSLKRLLNEKVRQDPDTMKRCKDIVHHLVKFMQHNLDCEVSEVVKGGSLGKGTSIREKVDIDLVVFMNKFKSVGDLQQNHEEVIKGLKKHILKDFTFAKQLHYSYDTKHSNRFSLRTDDGKGLISVDLLPACDIGGGSKSTFREMAGLSEEAKSYYSVSFVKDQVRFTRDKPEAVKDCTRLVKHWKTREKLNVPSYTAEILTSKEWERMGKPPQPDLDQLFKRTMTQLSDLDRIKVAWPNSRSTGEEGPIVMDPANPFNNTASMIDHSDQQDIEKKAREVVTWL